MKTIMDLLDEMMKGAVAETARAREFEREYVASLPEGKTLEREARELRDLYPLSPVMFNNAFDEAQGSWREDLTNLIRMTEVAPDSVRDWAQRLLIFKAKEFVFITETVLKECVEKREGIMKSKAKKDEAEKQRNESK